MNKFKLILVIFIFSIFCFSGILKVAYPNPILKNFYLTVGIFELILATSLLFFSNRAETWLILLLVFACWGGYALYTTLFGLPCSCLGAALPVPRGVSFGLNLTFFGSCWGVLKKIYPTLLNFKYLKLFSAACFVLGFIFAIVIYRI